MSEQAGWRGAPDDPPTIAPHLQTKVSDGRLQFFEDNDAWISAEAVLMLGDCR